MACVDYTTIHSNLHHQEVVDFDDDIFPSAPSDTLPLAAQVEFTLTNFHPQFKCPLLQLPPEIRYQIWELATTTYCDPRRPYDRELHAWRPDHTGPPRVDTALLLTCRTIYSEAWDLPIRQTPLVIFHSSEDDRPTKGRISLASFDMKPWHLLCLEAIEISCQQTFLHNELKHCIRKLENAHSLALGQIEYYLQENHSGVRQCVLNSILRHSIRDIVVQLNRRDWSTWESQPYLNDGKRRARSRRQTDSLDLDITIPPQWTNLPGLFGKDFEFTLVLETFGAKRAQLQQVVKRAKRWVFQAPLGTDAARPNWLVWDGIGREEKWDLAKPEVFGWMQEAPWNKEASRVEVVKLKYVLY